MFFIASKLLIGILNPFHWVIIGLLISLIIKSPRSKLQWRIAVIILFLFFGNRALINAVYIRIEPQPLAQDKIIQSYSFGILLGGGFAHLNPRFPDRIIFRDHINRLTESMELFQSGKIKKLILSGGDGSLSSKKELESQNILTFLLENNWPDSAILVESKSRNTYENARNVKHILDSLQVKESVLLITSALHMPRAQRCFAKQGIHFISYPADYRQRNQLGLLGYLVPDISCFDEWQSIFKEWIGIIAYRMKGYV